MSATKVRPDVALARIRAYSAVTDEVTQALSDASDFIDEVAAERDLLARALRSIAQYGCRDYEDTPCLDEHPDYIDWCTGCTALAALFGASGETTR